MRRNASFKTAGVNSQVKSEMDRLNMSRWFDCTYLHMSMFQASIRWHIRRLAELATGLV